MTRGPRIDIGDQVYHVINRANGRANLFYSDADYADFKYLLNEIRETYDMRILAYVLMPNHWHLLLFPRKDGDLQKAMHWLTTSHVRRHHARKGTVGHGHLYQGTYKSFRVDTDQYFLTVLKYIERNAARAGLAESAEGWRWGSAYQRLNQASTAENLLAELPVPLPAKYQEWINDPEPAELLKSIRESVRGGKIRHDDIVDARDIMQ